MTRNSHADKFLPIFTQNLDLNEIVQKLKPCLSIWRAGELKLIETKFLHLVHYFSSLLPNIWSLRPYTTLQDYEYFNPISSSAPATPTTQAEQEHD